MKFNLAESIAVLERTPAVLNSLLRDMPACWTENNEGENTWSPYDVIGHLIHGELTDWIPRMEIIISSTDNKKFEPFDRLAQVEASKGKSLNQLLDEFEMLRHENLDLLKAKELTEEQYHQEGIHPEFGSTKLNQLLATWVAHDLGHIAQISRVMAKQYTEEVGPWKKYLRVLGE